ncbi:MAG: 16S rRNA (guanine(966)-N(2))-methyltransferase RsmD [Legionella sp.]|nr:16S rRNA (guanine(966)-N(2))-methyltransferase RsmD [Legionella sp.]
MSVVRIIGGKYRGKKISFPNGVPNLRPTPNRVRETLFNWLMDTIRGKRCLDAFAGSGALGLEAYSRGASNVVFLESVAKVFEHLKAVVATFATTELRVLRQQAELYFKNSHESFDLVFLDPPFQQNLLPMCFERLSKGHILVPGGKVYVESPEICVLDERSWELIKAKRAGNVYYALYEKKKRDLFELPPP